MWNRRKPAHLRRPSANRNAPDELVTALRRHARSSDLELLVRDGWLPLVRDCHEAVEAEFPDYELLAVKQKYGQLAFQAFPPRRREPGTWTDDEARRLDDLIEQFEERSLSVCEECGRNGDLRYIEEYVLVLCNECLARLTR